MTEGNPSYDVWKAGGVPCPHCGKEMREYGNGFFCQTNGCPNYKNVEMLAAFQDQENFQGGNG